MSTLPGRRDACSLAGMTATAFTRTFPSLCSRFTLVGQLGEEADEPIARSRSLVPRCGMAPPASTTLAAFEVIRRVTFAAEGTSVHQGGVLGPR